MQSIAILLPNHLEILFFIKKQQETKKNVMKQGVQKYFV